MKTLLLLLVMTLIGQCGPYQKELDATQYRQIYIIEYGDERFHDCKELLDVYYGVTFEGDTVEIKVVQRPCPGPFKMYPPDEKVRKT